MTRIKLCGLTREADIWAANRLAPDYVGFVFAPGSRRYVDPARAAALAKLLAPGIRAVGVFADEAPERVAALLQSGVIDLAQLHGHEDPAYIRALRKRTGKPLIQAIQVRSAADLDRGAASPADLILLDGGSGAGRAFDWGLLGQVNRPYLLAGGLDPANVGRAVRLLRPWGVDVSSGIETEGVKDPIKMAAFVAAVRQEKDGAV